MKEAKIHLKDGTVKTFTADRRSGGSWELGLRAELGFVVVVDVWGKETWIPKEGVELIETR